MYSNSRFKNSRAANSGLWMQSRPGREGRGSSLPLGSKNAKRSREIRSSRIPEECSSSEGKRCGYNLSFAHTHSFPLFPFHPVGPNCTATIARLYPSSPCIRFPATGRIISVLTGPYWTCCGQLASHNDSSTRRTEVQSRNIPRATRTRSNNLLRQQQRSTVTASNKIHLFQLSRRAQININLASSNTNTRNIHATISVRDIQRIGASLLNYLLSTALTIAE